jgi:acyl carrier protein
MRPTETTFDQVKSVLVTTLGIEKRADAITAATPLLDSLPELDSLAVVQVVYALEEHFGVTIGDDEVTVELFETLGSLSAFVETKVRSVAPCT